MFKRIGMAAIAALALAGGHPGGTLEVAVEGLRNDQGMVRICLTRDPAFFPDCAGDPAARRASLAADAGPAHFAALPAGSYAVSVIHDENANGRLDKMLRIPREGFGFSRNPVIRFGPPRFDEVRFAVDGAPVRQVVRIRYIL